MKLLPSVMLIFMVSCRPSVKEAIAYNESIVAYHVNIDKKLAFLADTYDNYVSKEMDTAYVIALSAVREGIDSVSNMEAFHGDESYKKAALDLFATYKSVIETEHAQIIKLLKLPAEQYQQKEINEFDRLKESADKKIREKIDEVAKIQAEFAKNFNFQIDEKRIDE
jgi:hypothetical protein